MEIQKSPRWRHLYFHKQSIDTKYRYVTVSWSAVGGWATDGPPDFLHMLYLYYVASTFRVKMDQSKLARAKIDRVGMDLIKG